MGPFSEKKKCAFCGSSITRDAPVSSNEGAEMGIKLMKGQATQTEVEEWYKALGAVCPDCGSLSCSYCFNNNGNKCPKCNSKIIFFY